MISERVLVLVGHSTLISAEREERVVAKVDVKDTDHEEKTKLFAVCFQNM
jgi:hypothetical protein